MRGERREAVCQLESDRTSSPSSGHLAVANGKVLRRQLFCQDLALVRLVYRLMAALGQPWGL